MAEVPDVTVDDGGESNGGSFAFFDELTSIFGSAKDSLVSGAASVSAALSGVTLADVKAGTVDPLTLSREQRAQLFIEGATGGPIPNPWSVASELSSIEVAQLGAGGVLVFDVTTNAALALVDNLAPPRFALLWDDEIVETQGPVPTAVFGTSTLVVEVGPRRGSRLTLFTDATLSASFRKLGPPGSLDRILSEEKAAKNEESNPIAAAIDKFLNVQLGVGLAVVAVVGVAVVLLITTGELSKTTKSLNLVGGV